MKTAILLLLAACSGCPGPSPVPPNPQPPTVTCADWCAHARELGCEAGSPTPAGATCETVCGAAQSIEPWNLACRARAETCDVAEGCED